MKVHIQTSPMIKLLHWLRTQATAIRASSPCALCKAIIAGIGLSGACCGYAQGTAFTYQGRLSSNGTALNGTYDVSFALYNASTGGSQVGSAVTNSSLSITGGLLVA